MPRMRFPGPGTDTRAMRVPLSGHFARGGQAIPGIPPTLRFPNADAPRPWKMLQVAPGGVEGSPFLKICRWTKPTNSAANRESSAW